MHALLFGFAKWSITLRSFFDILENGISGLQKEQNQGNGSVFNFWPISLVTSTQSVNQSY